MYEFYIKLLQELDSYAQKCHLRLCALEARALDPNQPRDERGRWISGGGTQSANRYKVDLLKEEGGKHNGHTIERHVGKTPQELR